MSVPGALWQGLGSASSGASIASSGPHGRRCELPTGRFDTHKMTTTDNPTRGEPGNPAGAYLSFLALTACTVVGLMALGHFPTRELAGDGALAAMVAGCLISFVAALIGTVPVMLARGLAAPNTVSPVMASMAMRLGAVALMGVAAAWSGWFETGPLLIWLLISHTALLAADIRLTQRILYSS